MVDNFLELQLVSPWLEYLALFLREYFRARCALVATCSYCCVYVVLGRHSSAHDQLPPLHWNHSRLRNCRALQGKLIKSISCMCVCTCRIVLSSRVLRGLCIYLFKVISSGTGYIALRFASWPPRVILIFFCGVILIFFWNITKNFSRLKEKKNYFAKHSAEFSLRDNFAAWRMFSRTM